MRSKRRTYLGAGRRRRPGVVRQRGGDRLPGATRAVARGQRAGQGDAQPRARCCELVGSWPRAEEVDGEALDDRHRARRSGVAGLVRDGARRGRPKAGSLRRRRRRDSPAPREHFTAAGADDGTGQVLHLAGTVAAQRGDYDTAKARYEESLVDPRAARRPGEPRRPLLEPRRRRRVPGRLRRGARLQRARARASARRSATGGPSACPRTTSG